MEKLVERETAPRTSAFAAAPALAVQFFLIPLAVVAVLVAVYAGFQLLLTRAGTPEDYLTDVRTGTRDRRWPAAFELSRRLADPDVEAKHPELGRALLDAFNAAKNDDPRVRRYLALALGRLKAPAPGTVPALLAAVRDPDSSVAIAAVWALGMIRDGSAVAGLTAAYESKDAGIRKAVVYSLGLLPGDTQRDVLHAALSDPVPVRTSVR
jgi:hypothetical protein